MKFEQQKIIVKLGEGEDQAILTFREPLENERLQMVELGRENLRKALQLVYNNCLDVENLFIEEREIIAQDVRDGNIQGTVADAIAIGYYSALNPVTESAEKKG